MTYTSKIGIGTVQFGVPYGISNFEGQTPEMEVSNILALASNFGIEIIDTAASYGNSEVVLGKYLSDRFDVVSKFMPSSNGVSVTCQFEDSLNALKKDHLYGYLAHRPLELISTREDWEEIQILKSNKKISKIGFSLNDPAEYYLLTEANIIPDIVQVPFNYFDSRFKEIAISLKEQGCEVHTRSTFLQGLFFMDTKKLSDFFTPLVSNIEYLQETYGNSLSASLLKYVLDQPFIDKVILGVEKSSQLEDNLNGLVKASQLPALSTKFTDNLIMPMHWPKKKYDI